MGRASMRERRFPVSLLIFFNSWIARFNLLLRSLSNLHSQILSLKVIRKYPFKLASETDVSASLGTKPFLLLSPDRFNCSF